jgi:hypothetical protein
VRPREARDEMLDERRLSRARLAADEHDLPFAAERTRETILQELELARAADEHSG